MGIFDVFDHKIILSDTAKAKDGKSSSDELGVKNNKKQLEYISKVAKDWEDSMKAEKYSKAHIKSNFIGLFPYETPLRFELFKFPLASEVTETDTRILVAIKRILEAAQKVMLEIGTTDDTIKRMLPEMGNILNKTLDDVILERIVVNKKTATWSPKPQTLAMLKGVVDNLDKSVMPKPLDASEKESETKLHLIVLTLITQTENLMGKLSKIALKLSTY